MFCSLITSGDGLLCVDPEQDAIELGIPIAKHMPRVAGEPGQVKIEVRDLRLLQPAAYLRHGETTGSGALLFSITLEGELKQDNLVRGIAQGTVRLDYENIQGALRSVSTGGIRFERVEFVLSRVRSASLVEGEAKVPGERKGTHLVSLKTSCVPFPPVRPTPR